VAPTAATRLTEDVLPPDLFEKLKPEFVAPFVLYLCSDTCSETGMIFNAGMGLFNRAAVVTGPGAVVGSREVGPTPEEIHGQWAAINDLHHAKESYNLTGALGDMLEAFEPKGKPKSETGDGLTVKAVFDGIEQAFQPEKAAGVDVVFQYQISGPGGGEWNVIVKDKKCQVAPGKHEKPTTTIIMSDEDFLALMTKKLNAMQAYTTGKLKIQGDLMKSQLIEKLFKF
jgi:putative sterol carrier protein